MNVLIVGYGSIGYRHATNIAQLFPTARIFILESSGKALSTYPREDFVVVSREDLNTKTFDYSFICNPSSLHFEYIQRLLPITKKRILVEKPAVTSQEHARILLGSFDISKVYVLHQKRFHPISKAVREYCSTRMMQLVSYSLQHSEHISLWHPGEDYKNSYASRRDLGGGALNTLNHDYDLATFLFGSPAEVDVITRTSGRLGISCETDYVMSLRHSGCGNEIIGHISADYYGVPPRVVGSLQFMDHRIDFDFNELEIKTKDRVLMKLNQSEIGRNFAYLDMLREVFTSPVRGGQTLPELEQVLNNYLLVK